MARLLALGAALLWTGTAAAGERPRVVVVKSSDLFAYTALAAAFRAEVKAEVTEVTLDDNAEAARKALRAVAESEPAMVLAVGPAAATGAKRDLADVPVVFCMVPYYERYGLEGAKMTGIALTNDLSLQLETLKAVSSGAKRVGILHDPRYSAKVVEEAQRAAVALGMTVVGLDLDASARAEKVLKAARGKVDGLLMIADKTVANAAVVKTLISFAQEAKLPLVALSSSQVKEGALLSLSPSYAGLGEQAGRLANRIVGEKVDPGALAVVPAEAMDLALNLTAARRAGSCEGALELLKVAAHRGYAVKVFE